ncbi:MAG TPA: diguanylate cyclase [Polyangiaceae bacterium]|nr:diguanylate cyclase [Polyangiaceae bacterium]
MIPYPTPDPSRVSLNPPLAERAGRILVVDPDEQRRTLVRSMLDAEGYQAVYLSDGDEALRLTSEYEPDLILLAVELPRGSGLELCGQIRASDPRRHYPVLLLGKDDEEQSAARGLLAGADDFMAHPIREVELRARVRVQLRNKRFYDALERLRDERDSLRRDAQIDPLTNVLNRRSLEASMQQRCQLRERFGVLFLDLDHFKQVNDRFGHDCGDRVLIAVANVIRSGLRPGDIIGRYGGEEFVAIVAGAGPESARLVAERLRLAVEEMVPPSPGPSRVTISIGTTVFDPRQLEETPQELVHRADLALYAAKRGGRNRVVLVPPGETLPELEGKESLHPPRASIPTPSEASISINWAGRSG